MTRITRLLRITLSLAIFSLMFNNLSAQDSQSVVQEYLNENQSELKMTSSDVSSWVITKEYLSKSTNVTHVYINQLHNGIEIVNGTANFNILDGEVFSMGDRLVKNVSSKANASSPSVSPFQAIEKAATQLDIVLDQKLKIINPISSHEFVFDKAGISLEDIPVKLVYQYTLNNELRLSWDLSINTLDGQNWWSVRVDAVTGKIIDRNNWTTQCDFGSHKHLKTAGCEDHFGIDLGEAPSAPLVVGSYNVFAIPTESPSHGPRSIVQDPEDAVASPFGWHDDNGVAGSEYTITRGNNVHAYEDQSDNNTAGDSPDGGVSLTFDNPYDVDQPAIDNLDAAITNLFYMNNIMHDVWYQYGFDEPSGNFQETHYTSTGGFDGDYVRAEGLDGSGTSNANFSTPTDGTRPRMQMYLWPSSASNNFFVNAPPSSEDLDIEYVNSLAGFGPDIPSVPIIADLVLVTDEAGDDANDACEDIVNSADLDGKIAVIRRGTCEFGFKVLAAESEGAVAVIVVNNVAGAPVTMGAGAVGNQVSIPSIMLSSAQGEDIIEALENGDLVNGTLVDDSAGQISADSDFDNGIIAHEYGHGISIRLTGGGNNSNCLGNDEQMGEGWSDWFGIMLTIQPGDQAADPRGVGTYVIGQGNNGNGIRPAPYSTSFAVNDFTYGDTNNDNVSQPHGIGFVWSTMLWDLNWALIDVYGYDSDVYTGSGGNNIAMQLVIDGLKLQPCSPGFEDGRDAILEADILNYDGAHQCLIWEVFANRGLGLSASQGSSFSRSDQSQAFDVPGLDVDVDENTLTADNDFAGVTFQWIDCSDNSEIAGETDQSFSPTASGEYSVIATESTGCSTESDCIDFVLVGVEEYLASNISISPNPTNGIINVNFRGQENIESIAVIDAQGKVVLNRTNVNKNFLNLDLTSNSPGIYTIQILSQNGSSVHKVILQ